MEIKKNSHRQNDQYLIVPSFIIVMLALAPHLKGINEAQAF